jgi:hypothetical protein
MRRTPPSSSSVFVLCLLAALWLAFLPPVRAQNAPSVKLMLSSTAGDQINKHLVCECGHSEEPDADIKYEFLEATATYSGTGKLLGGTPTRPFTATFNCPLNGTNFETIYINAANTGLYFNGIKYSGCWYSYDGNVTVRIMAKKKQFKNGVWTDSIVYLYSNTVALHLDPNISMADHNLQTTFAPPFFDGTNTKPAGWPNNWPP